MTVGFELREWRPEDAPSITRYADDPQVAVSYTHLPQQASTASGS